MMILKLHLIMKIILKGLMGMTTTAIGAFHWLFAPDEDEKHEEGHGSLTEDDWVCVVRLSMKG
jgi:hypothetical protein